MYMCGGGKSLMIGSGRRITAAVILVALRACFCKGTHTDPPTLPFSPSTLPCLDLLRCAGSPARGASRQRRASHRPRHRQPPRSMPQAPAKPVSLPLCCLAAACHSCRQACAAGAGNGDLFNPIKSSHYATVGLHLKDGALNSLAGRVGAFGDFDSDQFTDIVWIHDDVAAVSVQRWNHKTDKFEAVPEARVELPVQVAPSAHGPQLTAVPSDFNFDGRMDLLVVSTDTSTGESDLLLYFGGLGAAPASKDGEPTGQQAGEDSQKASPRLCARPLVVGRARGQVRDFVTACMRAKGGLSALGDQAAT